MHTNGTNGHHCQCNKDTEVSLYENLFEVYTKQSLLNQLRQNIV